MGQKPSDKTICLHYCSYYKPGKNEELACGAYLVAERLLREGLQHNFRKPPRPYEPFEMLSGAVVQEVCAACDFRSDGCDFILDGKSPPCGGFLFLVQVLAEGLITPLGLK